MIKEVHIIHRDSGVPLIHVDLYELDDHLNVQSAIFSGALQGIRSFLKEANIGDLTKFITNENKIEVKVEKGIVVAIVSELNDPSDEVIEQITEDIGELFTTEYGEELKQFDGEVEQFESFISEIENYIQVLEEGTDEEEDDHVDDLKLKGITSASTKNLNIENLIDWAKNRFNPNASVKKDIKITCSPENDEIRIDMLLECGKRKMNRIDTWLGKRMGKGGLRNIIFIIELGASHGPAQIRQILQNTSLLGNPEYEDGSNIYPWFPAEIAFFGANLEKSSFNGLDDIIKEYKGEQIIIPVYAGHIHREHSPHHAFFRCRITGWKWNLNKITADNIPIGVFP
ncbi:MAG: hypothetical protein GF317_10365 [Candidatus Lokiarchaeota archaeon]|nr:hypothetical protein [Candidatus Lokiarchaeota archaeon]MBD3200057.1 hypothetical protein [Candidatus Lokiarchaeota archaeon]